MWKTQVSSWNSVLACFLVTRIVATWIPSCFWLSLAQVQDGIAIPNLLVVGWGHGSCPAMVTRYAKCGCSATWVPK